MFNSIVIPLDRYQIDVFTWGDSSLLAYQSSRTTLLRLHSFADGQSEVDRYPLSFSPTPSLVVRRLILNSAETIVALLTDHCVYLVNLPRETRSSSSDVRPSPLPTPTRPLDLLWLTEREYLVVHSTHCDLYALRWKHRRRFALSGEKSRKRLSLHQNIDIVQVSVLRREGEVFLFALQANGEVSLLTLPEAQLTSDLQSEFVGPLRFSPSKFDNYGADYSHSKMFAFCSSTGSIVLLLSNGKCELFQYVFLSSSSLLYNIDSLVFPSFRSLLLDRVHSNRYYLLDGQSNVYTLELRWLDELDERQGQLTPTKIDKLIQGDDLQIEQIALIQTSSQGQCLALINRQRKLILSRPRSFVSPSSFFVSRGDRRGDVPVGFAKRLRTVLQPDSTGRSAFSEEFLERQEKVREQLENKQRYLLDFHQTQLIANEELTHRFKEIQKNINIAQQRFEEECARHRRLVTSLGSVEVPRASLSDAERLMHQTMEKYQLQSNTLGEKLRLLADSLSDRPFDQREQLDRTKFQRVLEYYRAGIQGMKERID